MGALRSLHEWTQLRLKPRRGYVLLLIAGLICLALAFAPNAHAQAPSKPVTPTPPVARPAPDAAYVAAERAFLDLPDAERRTIQEALIWSGDYKGLADGGFGRGTRAAMIAWATRQSLPTDGVLDAAARQKLAAAAAQARQAIGFAPVTDDKTGAGLSLPSKLVPKKTPSATGTRWASADGAISLETRQSSDNDEALAILFAQLIAEGPTRKITYKAMRPNFMVVSGQSGDSAFYTYLAIGPAGPARSVRGYTFAWPKGRPDLEIVNLAIASSFRPFPTSAATLASAGTAAVVQGAGSAAPPIIVNAAGSTGARAATLSGTSLALTPTLLVTSLGGLSCLDPSLGKSKLKLVKADAASGLSLFDTDSAKAIAATWTEAGAPAAGDKLLLLFASGPSPAGEISVTEGSWLPPLRANGRARLIAPVPAIPGGSVVLDRTGRLIGIVEGNSSPAERPRGPANIISAREIAAFAGSAATIAANPSGQPIDAVDTASIVGRTQPALAALFCQ